jgi:hypothetical protein
MSFLVGRGSRRAGVLRNCDFQNTLSTKKDQNE